VSKSWQAYARHILDAIEKIRASSNAAT